MFNAAQVFKLIHASSSSSVASESLAYLFLSYLKYYFFSEVCRQQLFSGQFKTDSLIRVPSPGILCYSVIVDNYTLENL